MDNTLKGQTTIFPLWRRECAAVDRIFHSFGGYFGRPEPRNLTGGKEGGRTTWLSLQSI